MKVVPFKSNSSLATKLDSQYDMLPPLLNINEVCEYLGLGKTIVYEMIRKGELPHIRIRSRIRVSAADIQEYIQKFYQQPYKTL